MQIDSLYRNKVGDGPNLFQQKQAEYSFCKTEKRFKLVYTSKLEKMYASSSLNENQYRAGLRLYEEAYNGGVLSQIKAIDPTKCSSPRDKNSKYSGGSNHQAECHQSFSNAFYSEDLTEEHRSILWWVCICDNGTASYQKNRSETIGLLRESLNRLSHHYKNR